MGTLLSGGNPVGGVIAASSNVFLSHTEPGRKLTQVAAKEVFDDMLGFSPQFAHMVSSITLNAAMNWGLNAAYNAIAETPTASIDWDNPISDINDPKYSEFLRIQNMGESNYGAGGNIVDTLRGGGTAYPILDEQGGLSGIYAQKGAFTLGKLPDIGINHIAVVMRDANGGFTNSMAGLGGFNLYGVTSVCHQMSNQALLKAGYDLTVNNMSGGWFSYITGAVYGPYGSTAPATSYFEWEKNH